MDKQLLKEICERKPQQFRMKVSFFMNVQNISPSSVYIGYHSMARANLNEIEKIVANTTAAASKRLRICIN